jgi:DNA helicase-2/ATP-dependent DNA helicase PcrA
MDTAFPFTDEQIDCINAATMTNDNLMISALAGTGKTSTLEAIERSIKPAVPALYLVFNKKNADEASKRMLSTTQVRTFNSMGHRIWANTQSKRLTIDAKKINNLMREIIDKSPREQKDALWAVYASVVSGIGLAKALGYVPDGAYPNAKRLIGRADFHRQLDEEPDDLTTDLIDAILKKSIKLAYDGLLDYNDQVYMPALFGGTFPRFPLVLVDEYQDLSPVNHVLLSRLVKARLIGVGDPYQNIYGFRGAKAGGMSQATQQYSCQSLPLSTSFRCPSAIVKHVHWRVPTFRWLTEGGSVDRPQRFSPNDLPDEATIICRNNAPLLGCALRLLSIGRSIAVSGSDIGPRLVGIMRKLGPETLPREGVLQSIAEWRADKLEKESKSANDLADCMQVFAGQGKTLSEAIAYAEYLFKQGGRIQLTTGHKAKGLEWGYVVHLDPWLVRRNPSVQDQNLDYVISTRSFDRLVEVDSEQIEW